MDENENETDHYSVAELIENEDLRESLIGRYLEWVLPYMSESNSGAFKYTGPISEVDANRDTLFVWMDGGSFYLSGGNISVR